MPHLSVGTGQRQSVALLARAAGDVLPLLRASRSVHRAEVLVAELLLEDAAAYGAGTLEHLAWRQSAARARAVLDPPAPSPRAVARLARALDLESVLDLAHAYALLASGRRRERSFRAALDRWDGLIAQWVASQPQLSLYPVEGGAA